MAAIIPAAAIGAAVGAELPKLFNDALDQFGSGEGVYLRDGEPSGVVAKVGQAVGRAYCRAYDSVRTQYPAGRGERIEKACRPYLDSIGSAGGPGLKTPFAGGQCLCSVYSVRANISFTDDGVEGTTFLLRRVRGPLVSVTASDNGTRPTFTFVANNVSDLTSDIPTCRPAGTTVTRTFAPSSAFPDPGSVTLTSVEVTLVSGPDTCGDAPPVTTTPRPNPNPQPPPFRFNPDPSIDVPINVEIFPDATFTFNIGGGPITINPFQEGEPGGEPGGGTGGNPTPEPGTPGQPQDTGAGGEGADGDAPEGKVLTGVKLDVLDAPPSRRRFTADVDRGVAYVYMGTPEEGLALEPTGATMRSGQFFFAQKDYLTRHSVRANVGYNVRVTPYYRDKEE